MTMQQIHGKEAPAGGIKRRLSLKAIAIAVAAAILLGVILCVVMMSKSSDVREVRARYDGQTYEGRVSSSYSPVYSNGSMFDSLAGNSTSKAESVTSGFSGGMDYSGSDSYDFDASFSESAQAPEHDYDIGIQDAVGQHGKKIAYYYDFTCETMYYDAFLSDLETHVTSCGGYVENRSTDAREFDKIGGGGIIMVRRAIYNLRVPADEAAKFDLFLSSEQSEITSSNVRMTDKTAAYADADLQAESYRAEYARLEQLIPSASSVSELIEIQDRLSSLNYQIQWAEKQKALIDEDVSMSSVSLTVYEVEYYTATVQRYRFSFGERFAEAFEEFIYALPMFLFIMVYFAIGGFVVIGLCSILFRVLFNIRNKKSKDQIVRLIHSDGPEKSAGDGGTDKRI